MTDEEETFEHHANSLSDSTGVTAFFDEEFSRKFIAVQVRNERVFLAAQHVRFLQAGEKIVTLTTVTGERYDITGTITKLLEQYPGLWVRTHRNAACKPEDIVMVKDGKAHLVGGAVLPVTRRGMDALSSKSFRPTAREPVGYTTPKLYEANAVPSETKELQREQKRIEIRKLQEAGLSQKEIGEKLGIAPNKVSELLPVQQKSELLLRKKEIYTASLQLHRQGFSRTAIAEQLNVSRSYISKLLKDDDCDVGLARPVVHEASAFTNPFK